MKINFIGVNPDSLFADLPTNMLMIDLRFILGNDPNITTFLPLVSLSDVVL
jgi:hypothetical protein